MFHSLSGLWKARRGRKAAVAAILPLVERSRIRCHGIAEGTWLDPYMIGFMMMLITLTARHKVSELDSLFLGLVQQEAWADITGMRPELVGERAMNLSASGNKVFALGCQNAIAFEAALSKTTEEGVSFDDRVFSKHTDDGGLSDVLEIVLTLWTDCFESHVVWDSP